MFVLDEIFYFCRYLWSKKLGIENKNDRLNKGLDLTVLIKD
jgi:hypothetical protein